MMNFIIDSGAFSAWRLGKPINLVEYCDWLLANREWITSHVALDVINPNDPEAAAAEGCKNLEYMLGRGLEPIMVFHVGEDIKYLHRMLDMGCKYIGLAALSADTQEAAAAWYDYAWSHLVDRHGDPVVKVHAFGDGKLANMLRFPWYSADSSSWMQTAARGGSLTINGRAKVSMRHDGLDRKGSPEIRGLKGADSDAFASFLRRHKVKPEALEVLGPRAYVVRIYLEALQWKATQATVRAAQPIRYRGSGFFSGMSKRPPIEAEPFNLHLASSGNKNAYVALAMANHPNMLESYFYIRTANKTSALGFLPEYQQDPRGACISSMHFADMWNRLKDSIYE